MIIQPAHQYSGTPVLTSKGKPWMTGWIMTLAEGPAQHFKTLKAAMAAWREHCDKNERVSWDIADMFE
jgi:hypothetical protein